MPRRAPLPIAPRKEKDILSWASRITEILRQLLFEGQQDDSEAERRIACYGF